MHHRPMLDVWQRLVVGVAPALISVTAWAQAPAPAAKSEAVEEIVVTGSRIASPNATSTSPIQVIDAKEIQQTGMTDISDVLYQLPQNFSNAMGAGFSGRTPGLTTPGGLTTVDLRGMGPQRTLVLINGRRLGPGSPNTSIPAPAANLDQIPMALVERIDVVTGGASAAYGSDAIAGVVNFVLKRNFEGMQVDAQWGGYMHSNSNKFMQNELRGIGERPLTGTSFDGRSQSFSVIMGTNFADGRGNVTGYLSYRNIDPITSGQRDFGGCQLGVVRTGSEVTGVTCQGKGSANSNRFQSLGYTLGGGGFVSAQSRQLGVVGNQLLPWPADGQVPPDRFNSQQYIYISRQDQRYTAGFLAHLDLQDWFRPYGEFGFMNDQTRQNVAPAALFEDANVNNPRGAYTVNCSNPFLSAQQQAAIGCTAALIAADTAAPGSGTVDMRIGRRNVEGGARIAVFEHQNYRAVVGAKGDFAEAWSYDAYAQYYYTTLFNSNNKYLNFQAVDRALLVTGTAANPVCISGPPCVPYNIFQQGGVTPEALNYLYLSGTAYGAVTERILHGDVTGDLGHYGLQSPLAAEGLAINVGYEFRSDRMTFAPDAAELGGQLSGFGGAAVAIDRAVSLNEQFIELRAPLVQDQPFVKDLVFDAGFRRSDYSTIGSVNTHKFELQYAPVSDFRLRASLQRAIRAPGLMELYNPLLVGRIQFGEDPCAPAEATGVAAATLEQCLRSAAGVPNFAELYGNGRRYDPETNPGGNRIPQGTGEQLAGLFGGSTSLRAETADSYTIGVNFSPQALANFNASVDFYRIRLKDQINSYPGSLALQGCLFANGTCQYVQRDASGGLNGASVQSRGYILQSNVNIGQVTVEGIDTQLNYRLPLERFGSLQFSLAGTVNLANKTLAAPGATEYDCAGLFGFTCQTINPRWRHNLRTTWATPWWNTDISLMWRYLGAVSHDNNDSNPSLHYLPYGGYSRFNRRIPSYSYIDLSATWKILDSVQLRAGANNLFDKDPPLVSSDITAGGSPNTYETYDTLGRQLYLAVTAKF